MVTPKTEELIATPYRHGGSRAAAEQFFRDGFVDVFDRLLGQSSDGIPMTVFYAFKQAENDAEDGVASTGWSTLLEGLAQAGWAVTATWPMRTEAANRMVASGTNALASSVVLACRPRAAVIPVAGRQEFLRSLREQLPVPVHELQKAHIAPVDLRQAAIGPGMAVYFQFGRLVEPDSTELSVHAALTLINQVLDEVLDEQINEFDAETRWAIGWFSQFFLQAGPYGTAEQLAVSMNIAVGTLVDAGILESGQGKARLLGWEDLPESWDPRDDDHVPVWEATLHLVKRLAAEGEASAARLLGWMPPGMGDAANQLAYRLYTLCERSHPTLAGPFNALVASWPEILRQSREWRDDDGAGQQQGLDI